MLGALKLYSYHLSGRSTQKECFTVTHCFGAVAAGKWRFEQCGSSGASQCALSSFEILFRIAVVRKGGGVCPFRLGVCVLR